MRGAIPSGFRLRNVMRLKGFPLFLVCVILTAAPGCDNVRWDGVSMELRSADPPASAPLPAGAGDEDPPLVPLELGPIVYLAARTGGEARLLPLAEWRNGSYEALPDAAETPDLVERFPLNRWEEGTEFLLLDRGVRAGTFIADGSAEADSTSSCAVRPAGRGKVEIRPDVGDRRDFLAVRKADVERGLLPDVPVVAADFPEVSPPATLRAGALTAGRQVIAEAGIPWPPTIPEILRDQQPVPLAEGREAVAASFVFGDELAEGMPTPAGYSLFLLADRDEGEWSPFWIWYQRAEHGKAVPRHVASTDLRGTGDPDLLLEVFGTDARWFAVVGERNGEWGILYSDECGTPPREGGARPWP
jgi:hypothetical protein